MISTKSALFAILVGLIFAQPSVSHAQLGTNTANDSSKNQPPVKIALIGDSTVRDYPDDSPRRGWGQQLAAFLTSETILINEASSGRSTKTFPPDRWASILDDKPNFVLIQFGHDDAEAKDQPEATDANTDYKDNLRRYIADSRSVQAVPILITPPPPREFKDKKLVTTELAEYATAMREIGQETKTPVIDLYQEVRALYDSLGELGSAAMTVNKTGWDPKKDDRVHLTEEGARQLAKLVADSLPTADPKLAGAVKK